MNKKFLIITLGCILLFSIAACKKMNSTYVQYIEGGEISYAGKADSLTFFPGKGRLQLSWLRNQKIGKALLIWNAGNMQKEFTLDAANTGLWENVVLDGLNEGSYQFEVYTFDRKGNKSVKATASGSVYGSTYEESLLNRKVKTAVIAGLNAQLNWYTAGVDATAVEIKYTNLAGSTLTILDSASHQKTVLTDYLRGSEITYRTLYLPEGKSIDTFYSRQNQITL